MAGYEIETGWTGKHWVARAWLNGAAIDEATGETEDAARTALLHQNKIQREGTNTSTDGLNENGSVEKSKPDTLREGISCLLLSHPAVSEHNMKNTKYIHRYKLDNGRSVGHEVNGKTKQHLYLSEKAFPANTRPAGIPVERKPWFENGRGRNSNLNAITDFRSAAVLRFTIKSVEDAQRVIDAAAALPPLDPI